jgi:hypothetical protein
MITIGFGVNTAQNPFGRFWPLLILEEDLSVPKIPHSPGFSGRGCHRSSKASRCENLEIEQPVACRDFSSFDFYPALPSMLGAPLIRH